MKKDRIIYWVCTVLFAGFMTFSAIPDIVMEQETVEFIKQLGYPEYFIPFIGIAKLLGCVALVVPGFAKIREWAYAGLFFDLIGAVYSNIMVHGFDPGMIAMVPIFGIGITSYVYNEKIKRGVMESKV